ncbi:alpha-dextran endo-1,6-alpha-glucosidase, partial [candidate division KSB3 bacterium]
MKTAKARWISRDSLVWDVEQSDDCTPCLYYDPDGTLLICDGEIVTGENGREFELSFRGVVGENDSMYDRKLAYLPSLHGRMRIDTGQVDARELLDGALAIGIKNSAGKLLDATSIQTAGILDDFYAYDGELGVIFNDESPTLRLWSPTAQSVRLHLYTTPVDRKEIDNSPFLMGKKLDKHGVWTGVWEIEGKPAWKNVFYRYEVKVYTFWTGKLETFFVTDPYSVSLSTNSTRSQIVDLNDVDLQPKNWTSLQKPVLEALEDIVLYELHVRDFSISDQSVPTESRGRFVAFTESNSNGIRHLKGLSEAGLTHVHLLPVFDIATIEEERSKQIDLNDTVEKLQQYLSASQEDLTGFENLSDLPAHKSIRELCEEAVATDPASELPQKILVSIRDQDGFNWGYDPFHYGVPEGSYATNPGGSIRILEFRAMVKALSDIGLRVVMDVVYNHTHSARDCKKSVLDKVVPGYYYRLDDEGNIQNTTCCPDTATEHVMMEKLMLDTVKRWAVAYKVDGFRFDLMGHHTRSNMQKIRAMLDSLTLEQDGVDGTKIYVYGEGWQFGSIQENLPTPRDPDDITEQAAFTQTNAARSGIGTFNDRLRDALRGGNFDQSTKSDQGFATGLYTDYNTCFENVMTPESLEDQRTVLLTETDVIRLALAANLREFEFTNADNQSVKGKDIRYRGGIAGYTAQPRECINYVSAHDNYCLWDQVCAKAPFRTAGRQPETASAEERVRMQQLALSIVMLAQGIPFFHAGSEILRSKSGDGDSYHSGDWFNSLDFTYKTNKWGYGLPTKEKNENEWDFWRARLREPGIAPSREQILTTLEYCKALLRVRQSSRLFRLRTAEEIQRRVRFLNAERGASQIPGLIVMLLRDNLKDDPEIDPEHRMIVAFFNADRV